MSSAPVAYNWTLPPVAGPWIYSPYRQAEAIYGWNSSYTESPEWPWPYDGKTRGDGINYFRTQISSAQISITFEGTGIYFCFTDNGASFVPSLDGDATAMKTVDGSLDPVCSGTKSTKMSYVNNLTLGAHTAVLRVSASATSEFWFFGGALTSVVGTTASDATNITVKNIDDSDANWAWQPSKGSPNWDNTGGNAYTYNLTGTFICEWGTEYQSQYSFTGAGAAALFGSGGRDSHDYTVTLAGGGLAETLRADLSTTGWLMGTSLMYLRGNLDPTVVYTVTLQNYNSNNVNCTGYEPVGITTRACCSSVDELQLFSGSAPSTTMSTSPTSTSGGSGSHKKANIGAIVGGAIAGVAALAALSAFIWWYLRRRRVYDSDEDPYLPPARWDPPSTAHATAHTSQTTQPQPYGVVEPWTPSSGPPSTVPTSLSPRDLKVREATSSLSSAPATFGSASADAGPSTPGAPTPAPLAQHDLARVLQFVAQRMDRSGGGADAAAAADDGATMLPPYRAA